MVFMKLTIIQRIKIERVCKRWQVISKDNCWTDLKEIDAEFIMNNILTIADAKDIDLAFFNIFVRCGTYLQKLEINIKMLPKVLPEFLLTDIYRYCSALCEFNFYGVLMDGETDSFFGKIFLNNQNLSSVKIPTSFITGSCLSNLNPTKLKKLEIRLEKKSDNTLTSNFINFKNLTFLNIRCTYEQIDAIMDSRNWDNLTDLVLHRTFDFKSNQQPDYKTHFKKLSKVKHLSIYNITLKNIFLKELVKMKLNRLTLFYFEIEDYQQFLLSIQSFHELESLRLRQDRSRLVDDKFFQSFKQCKKIKFIELSIFPKITTEGVLLLRELPSIEVLIIERSRKVNAEIIKNTLKTIKNISINESTFEKKI